MKLKFFSLLFSLVILSPFSQAAQPSSDRIVAQHGAAAHLDMVKIYPVFMAGLFKAKMISVGCARAVALDHTFFALRNHLLTAQAAREQNLPLALILPALRTANFSIMSWCKLSSKAANLTLPLATLEQMSLMIEQANRQRSQQ